jgi:hypothetical protein
MDCHSHGGDTAEVIDVVILSRHFVCSNKLTGEHMDSCEPCYSGASGSREITGAKKIFSTPSHGIK